MPPEDQQPRSPSAVVVIALEKVEHSDGRACSPASHAAQAPQQEQMFIQKCTATSKQDLELFYSRKEKKTGLINRYVLMLGFCFWIQKSHHSGVLH